MGLICKATKAGRLKLRSISEANKLAVKQGKRHQNWTDSSRQRMRELSIKRELGGKRNSHRVEYNGVWLDSSYELRVAKLLERDGILWIRPKTRFIWTDEQGKTHKYLPDFFLTEIGIYLDPKRDNLVQLHDDKIKRVIAQNGVKVYVLTIKMIEEWEAGHKPLAISGS